MSYRLVLCMCAGALLCAPARASVFVDLVNDLDPIHWYRLGESPPATVAADSVGDDPLDGTFHNVRLGQEGAVFNDPDTSGGFFPSWVEVPHDDSLLLDQGSLGLCFKDLNTIEFAGLISKDSEGFDTGGHLSLLTTPSEDPLRGNVAARLQSGNESFLLEGPSFGVGDWHFVMFTWGDEGMELSGQGQLLGSIT